MQILKTKPYSSPLSTLDVPSSPRPPWWQSVPGQVALSAGAFLLVLFARRPETFLNPQLWAEDGFIFFVQADEFGARALTFSWAGYHNFLLRLIAVVSSPLNAQLVPAAYVGISLLVLLAVVLALFSPRLDLPARPACALALVLIPHTGEAIGNLTNLQWVCGLGLVWLLLARDASTMRQHVTDGIIALVFRTHRHVFDSLRPALHVARVAASHGGEPCAGSARRHHRWRAALDDCALAAPSLRPGKSHRGSGGVVAGLPPAGGAVPAGRLGGAGATRRARSARGADCCHVARDRVPPWQAPRAPGAARGRARRGDRSHDLPHAARTHGFHQIERWRPLSIHPESARRVAADLRLVAGGLDSVEHAHGVRPTPSHNRDALALRTPAGPALVGLRAPDRGGRTRRSH